jgi:cardiolipin synthase (CMP-forming)
VVVRGLGVDDRKMTARRAFTRKELSRGPCGQMDDRAHAYTDRDIMSTSALLPGPNLNLPNVITMARLLAVPVVIWAITSGQMQIACLLFLIAGVSDAVDGFLAKRFGMTSELGAHLDPLADKALIVSIYVALGIADEVPRWIVILVVSRDILIVGGVMLSWFLGKPITVRPLLVSKLNTVAQILFASLILFRLGFFFDAGIVEGAALVMVAVLSLLSVGFYVRDWVRHMNAPDGLET